ncbi:MAG: DUF2275 domain-containing protein [Nitrospirae bacterium]|nr:DUF2275 domain-containing protein [Nitrospirota bacterium]
MECINFQERLQAYLDGIISAEEKFLIDEHLKLCPKCNESLSDLRKTIEYVHNLEDIEPPSWLAQRVMARVRAEAEQKRGILQRLFYPLHIKLPIEIAATVAIAITTIYIFKAIQPEIRLAKAPQEETAPKILSEKDITQRKAEKGEKEIPPSPPLIKKGEREFVAEQPVPAKELQTKIDRLEESKAPESVKQEPLKDQKVAGAKREEAKQPVGIMEKDKSRHEVLSPAPKLKEVVSKKGEGIILTVNVKDIETARKEIEKELIQLGGKIKKIESSEKNYVILTELHSEKLEKLKEKLKLIGMPKERPVLYTLKGNIEIIIEVIKID